jgi:hypothetical protein
MTLSFQLARGAFALALMTALSLAAVLAPKDPARARLIIVTEAGTVTVACPVPPPALRLAAAPADLPALRRVIDSCRA